MTQLFKLSTIGFIVTFACFQILYPIPASASDKISQVTPQMLGTPEEDLSTLGSSGKKSKVGIWVGALLGVALVAALVAGGGGGDDDDKHTTTTSNDGEITVGW